ncbi:MAG TPA: hypothetical protein VFV23_13005 [Verrucomicrobiae bacterium]|nr:hypothetical protein [Verrucomicrobiae bacterium]
MKSRIVILFALFVFPLCSTAPATPLIVDHNAVAQYAYIPQQLIDRIKTRWVDIPGESHSQGYRAGCQLLQDLDSRFQVNVVESGTPESYTNTHLRISRATWDPPNSWKYSYGEGDWYTSSNGLNETISHLRYCNTNGLAVDIFGFAWCWDMLWHNFPGGGTDSVYHVRWAGASEGGPDGDQRWGLDADDFSLTGNHVSLDTYLEATQFYSDFCRSNGYLTKVFFTTGPVDTSWPAEGLYQAYLKHERIRAYVKASNREILFDYADILCWGDNGQQSTMTWKDFNGITHTFPVIHPDNLLNLDGSNGSQNAYHIGQRGALRLAKALWWMLAMSEVPQPTQVIQSNNGSFIIKFDGISNLTYHIEYCDHLTNSIWQTLGSATADGQGKFRFTNTPPADCPKRFYRAVYP